MAIKNSDGGFGTVIVIWQFYIGTSNKTALQLLQVSAFCDLTLLTQHSQSLFDSHLLASMNNLSSRALSSVDNFMIVAKCWCHYITLELFLHRWNQREHKFGSRSTSTKRLPSISSNLLHHIPTLEKVMMTLLLQAQCW